jgi:hypothetical protein
MRYYQTPARVWCPTQAAWYKAMEVEGHMPFPDIKEYTVEVPTGKPELLEWLNFHGVDALHLGNEPVTTGATVPVTDEAFEALPLPKQLHLAALALETARDKIKP